MSRRVSEGIYPDARIVSSLAAVGQVVYVEVQQYPFAFPAVVSNPISQTRGLTVTVDGKGKARVFGSGVTTSLERVTEFRKTRFIPPTAGEIVKALLFVEVINWRLSGEFILGVNAYRPQWKRTLYIFDQDGNRTTVIGTDWSNTALLAGIGIGLDPDDYLTYFSGGWHWVPGRGTLSFDLIPDLPSFLLDQQGWYFDRGELTPHPQVLILMNEPTPWGGQYEGSYSYPPVTYSVVGNEITKVDVLPDGSNYLGMSKFGSIPFDERPNVIKAGVTSLSSLSLGNSPTYVNINPKTQHFFPIVPLTYSPVPNQASGITGRFADLTELSAALSVGLIAEVPILDLPETLEQNGDPEFLGFGYSGDLFSYNTFRANRASWNFVELGARQAEFAPIDLSFISLADSQDKVFAATVGFVDFL